MLSAAAPSCPESGIPHLRYGAGGWRQQPSGDVPAAWDQLRIKFEALSVREAVELASELRMVARGRVQIHPSSPRLPNRLWNVTVTIPTISPALARAATAELRELALRHPGCRFVDENATPGYPATDGPLRVLIVDDSAPFRRAARELLQRRGYVVVGEVGSAAAAREAVDRLAPHALLMDVGLPDACGFELAGEMTRARPDLAVLLMSANDASSQVKRLDASGARGFVLKSCLAAVPLDRFWRAPSP
jgi:CheY-like chemotaxis protein